MASSSLRAATRSLSSSDASVGTLTRGSSPLEAGSGATLDGPSVSESVEPDTAADSDEPFVFTTGDSCPRFMGTMQPITRQAEPAIEMEVNLAENMQSKLIGEKSRADVRKNSPGSQPGGGNR